MKFEVDENVKPIEVIEQLENALPFSGLCSFMRAPVSKTIEAGDLVVVGVPFDAGATNRPGARYAPRTVREQSVYAAAFQPVYPWRTELTSKRRLVDFGDITAFPGSGAMDMMIALTENASNAVYQAGGRLLAIGGDHSLPIGAIRAASNCFGKIALIHLDAHQDSYGVDSFDNQPVYNHGVFATALVNEGCVDISASVQLYIRTIQPESPNGGYEIVFADEAALISPDELAERVRARVGDKPVYISFDIDAVDPAFAPGTGSPVPGGPSTGDVRCFLKALTGINAVGADLVEINPLYDPTGVTSIAGAFFAIDLLHVLNAAPNW